MKAKSFTKLKATKGIIVLAAFYSLFLVSCSGPSKTDSTVNESDTLVEATTSAKKTGYPLPTPFEITNMLNKAGASYILDISNPAENAGKYLTEADKALNLGIYGSDLSYATTYNRSEETIKYMANVKKLTDEVGVKSIINQNIIERVERNINNLDSLHDIISSSYYETFEVLNDQGKGDVAALVLAGGWIEGIYVAIQLLENSADKTEINKGIASQKSAYTDLITLLEDNKTNNQKIPEILAELTKVQGVFTSENLTDQQLASLKEIIVKIRTSITNI